MQYLREKFCFYVHVWKNLGPGSTRIEKCEVNAAFQTSHVDANLFQQKESQRKSFKICAQIIRSDWLLLLPHLGPPVDLLVSVVAAVELLVEVVQDRLHRLHFQLGLEHSYCFV